MIFRIVKMAIAPGKEKDFEAIFKEVVPHIRRFPGCREVRLLRAAGPDNVYFTLSIWDSEAALDSYRSSALFQHTWPRVKKLMDGRAEAWTTHPLA